MFGDTRLCMTVLPPAARPDPCESHSSPKPTFRRSTACRGRSASWLAACAIAATWFSSSARTTGPKSDQENVLPVPSVVLPFYKELHLPRPPFGRVHRAVAAFRPDIVHIATEATLGWSLLRYALEVAGSRSFRVFTRTSTSTAAITESAGRRGLIWRYLRWFHNSTRETYVPSNTTIRDLETTGLRATAALAARR